MGMQQGKKRRSLQRGADPRGAHCPLVSLCPPLLTPPVGAFFHLPAGGGAGSLADLEMVTRTRSLQQECSSFQLYVITTTS